MEPKTTYDWRIRWRVLMQTDIPRSPLRGDVTLVGDAEERIRTLRSLYDKGYLVGAAQEDAEMIFRKEPEA